jgi:formylglycine-generating enzyme required for sulfatase activity/serine/threonine protein kinase
MDQTEARRWLGLKEDAGAVAIGQAWQKRRTDLQQKLEAAPTAAHRQKFADLLEKVDLAYEALAEDIGDLEGQEDTPAITSNAGEAVGDWDEDEDESAPAVGNKPVGNAGKDRPAADKSAADDAARGDEGDRGADIYEEGVIRGDVLEAPVRLEPGEVLAGRYELRERIGEGSMGAIYRAHDRTWGEEVALKVVLPSVTGHIRARERFLDEARLSSTLSHPNIVKVFDAKSDGDYVFMSMELLEDGQSLRDLFEARKAQGNPFTEDEARHLGQTLCEALEYAHGQIFHRDIKPENIWVAKDGTYKLMDFGIARVMSKAERSRHGRVKGTTYYMAPEQFNFTANIDGRADQYAVGVLLYEALTGKTPTRRLKPLREARKDVSRGFASAVDRALAADPEKRHEDMAEFRIALTGRRPFAFVDLLPSRTVALAIVIVLLVGAVGTYATNIAIEAVRDAAGPMSAEELRALRTDTQRLESHVERLADRVHESREDLARRLRAAERDDSGELPILERWAEAADEHLFGDGMEAELQSRLAQARAHIEAGEFEQAVTLLQEVRDGYQNLRTEFRAAENLWRVELVNESARADWEAMIAGIPEEYELQTPRAATEARGHEQAAVQSESQGRMIRTIEHLNESEQAWRSAIATASDRVAEIEREIVEARRQAEEAAQRAEREAAEQARREAEAQARERAEQARQRLQAERERRLQQLLADNAMVNIPAGSFRMGDLAGSGEDNQRPVRTVQVSAFRMSRYAVTFDQYEIFAEATGRDMPDDEGWGRGSRPVINITWHEAQAYADWLSEQTGLNFRLPSEAEWEYAARAGTETEYPWGDRIGSGNANCLECGAQWAGRGVSSPAGSFAANDFGLYDMHGNVWEWVQDCWNDSYDGAPSNGSAWESGDCDLRVLRGGSWDFSPRWLRSAARNRYNVNASLEGIGFRVVQTP